MYGRDAEVIGQLDLSQRHWKRRLIRLNCSREREPAMKVQHEHRHALFGAALSQSDHPVVEVAVPLPLSATCSDLRHRDLPGAYSTIPCSESAPALQERMHTVSGVVLDEHALYREQIPRQKDEDALISSIGQGTNPSGPAVQQAIDQMGGQCWLR